MSLQQIFSFFLTVDFLGRLKPENVWQSYFRKRFSFLETFRFKTFWIDFNVKYVIYYYIKIEILFFKHITLIATLKDWNSSNSTIIPQWILPFSVGPISVVEILYLPIICNLLLFLMMINLCISPPWCDNKISRQPSW